MLSALRIALDGVVSAVSARMLAMLGFADAGAGAAPAVIVGYTSTTYQVTRAKYSSLTTTLQLQTTAAYDVTGLTGTRYLQTSARY